MQEHAFHGLVEMLRLHPGAAMGCLPLLFAAIASWDEVPSGLSEPLGAVATGYKAQVPVAQWDAFYSSFPEQMRSRLTARYHL